MKKLKFLSIAMMLVLGFSSCSEDGPSMGDIQENLEGSWFCTYAEWYCTYDGKYSCAWDFNNQTEDGIDTDGDNWDPMRLIIEATDDADVFNITSRRYYSGKWNYWGSGIFEIMDDVNYITIAEDGKTIYTIDDYDRYSGKVYIDKLNKNELTIVEEYKDTEDGCNNKNVYKFRRIEEED